MRAALTASGVRLNWPGATLAQDVEPEYVAISDDGATAWVTLQEANSLAVVDIATATVTSVVPLGLKDHSVPGQGLDASDRDLNGTLGTINITTRPVFGMYMPDAIDAFDVDRHHVPRNGERGRWTATTSLPTERRSASSTRCASAPPSRQATSPSPALRHSETTPSQAVSS